MPTPPGVGEDKTTPLINGIMRQESGDENHPDGFDGAIGDKNIAQHAYGPMQVRNPVCEDVNTHFGTTYSAIDCLNNRKLSIWMFCRYMEIYATSSHLGRTPTDQDRARIWNGGPGGWKNPGTLEYWALVQKKIPV